MSPEGEEGDEAKLDQPRLVKTTHSATVVLQITYSDSNWYGK